jgi:hypothetical protein
MLYNPFETEYTVLVGTFSKETTQLTVKHLPTTWGPGNNIQDFPKTPEKHNYSKA